MNGIFGHGQLNKDENLSVEFCRVNPPSKPPSPAVLSPPELPGVIAVIPEPKPEIEAEEAFVEEEEDAVRLVLHSYLKARMQ